jgi:hypothetical protein
MESSRRILVAGSKGPHLRTLVANGEAWETPRRLHPRLRRSVDPRVVVVRWWPTVAIPVLILLTASAAAGCAGPVRTDPMLVPVVEAASAPAGLPIVAYRSGDLLRNEAGRCGGQRVSFGGRPEDGAAFTLEVVRFRDAEAAARAAARMTPAWLTRHVAARAVAPPEFLDTDVGGPPEAITTLRYDARVGAAERTATGVSEVSVLLTAARVDRVVAVVESIGLPAERQAEVMRQVADAALTLPDRNCWGQEPIAAPAHSDAAYVVWGGLLLLVLSGIVLLPIAALASWSAGARRRSLAMGLLWLGMALLGGLWFVVMQ